MFFVKNESVEIGKKSPTEKISYQAQLWTQTGSFDSALDQWDNFKWIYETTDGVTVTWHSH